MPPQPALPAAWLHAQAPAAASASWRALLDDGHARLEDQALTAARAPALAALRARRSELEVRGVELDNGLRPTTSVTLSASRALDTPGALTLRGAGSSLSLAWQADLLGRNGHQLEAARLSAQAARLDEHEARLAVRRQLAERWWRLALLERQAPLLAEQRRLQQELLALQRARWQQGKLLPVDVEREAVALAQLESRVAQAADERHNALLQLALLLDSSELPTADGARLPAAATPPDWQLAPPAQALAARADVQRARLSLGAALHREAVAQLASYPTLAVNLGLGTSGARWQDWLKSPVATLAANLALPFLDAPRLALGREQARGDVQIAALVLRDTLHRALVEIERLVSERERLLREAAAQRAQLHEALALERVSRARFEAGSVARSAWLSARVAVLAAEQQVDSHLLRLWLNHAALHEALAV
jgi:outer membrane protein TolC